GGAQRGLRDPVRATQSPRRQPGTVRRRSSADHARRPHRRPDRPTRRGDPVTTHPIDTEALRREALGQLGLAAMDPRWPGRVLSLLDALAAAEHRATRAEAERDGWRQTALDERGAALDA